jgi:cellulose synthase/poly-beta-1,6-N-acetylglucosamine synthase-like glycosyltransferase
MVLALDSDDTVGAVGAHVVPGYSSKLDHAFWAEQNFLRLTESRYYSSSSVSAPLYAFKRECFDLFPEDCIADDLFVSFMCNRKGKRVVYLEKDMATELRGPGNMSEYIKHKFRKAYANMRETYRFIPFLREYSPRWKFVFMNRLGQLIFAPFAFLFFVILSLSYLWTGSPTAVGVVVAACTLAAISGFLVLKEKKALSGQVGSLQLAIISLFLTNAVLFMIHLTYPFIKKDSKYEKVR